jgi:hypothetical protein
MSVQTTAQGALAILESDVLTAAGGPLLTFLTAIKPVGTTPVSPTVVAGAWIQLHGALLMALPALEATVETQIITSLQAKLAQFVAPK